VRHDGCQSSFVDALPEPDNFVAVERFADPLIRVFAKDLERFAAMGDGALDRFRYSSRD
jgi:hypothetical protein